MFPLALCASTDQGRALQSTNARSYLSIIIFFRNTQKIYGCTNSKFFCFVSRNYWLHIRRLSYVGRFNYLDCVGRWTRSRERHDWMDNCHHHRFRHRGSHLPRSQVVAYLTISKEKTTYSAVVPFNEMSIARLWTQ